LFDEFSKLASDYDKYGKPSTVGACPVKRKAIVVD
jgi:hypothetical protein